MSPTKKHFKKVTACARSPNSYSAYKFFPDLDPGTSLSGHLFVKVGINPGERFCRTGRKKPWGFEIHKDGKSRLNAPESHMASKVA